MSDLSERSGYIRASEIGEFIYCEHQWWLRRVRGVGPSATARMQAGTRYHREYQRQLHQRSRREWAVYLLIGFAAIIAVFGLLIAFVG